MASQVGTESEAGSNRIIETKRSATRMAVSAFGALAAMAGIEHGVGALPQGSVAPSAVVFESGPDTAGFEVVSGSRL